MPLPRTEVAAATVENEILVLGGLTLDRGASRRVDAYSPALDRWRRLPDLPIGVHHAMAVGTRGRLYVLGGYTAAGVPLRTLFVLERDKWRPLPRMPFPRAAAGAGVAGQTIVVAGGVGAGRRLARNALSFDLRTIAGPLSWARHRGSISESQRSPEPCMPLVGERPGSTRTSSTSRVTGPAIGHGAGSRPCRIHAEAPAPRPLRA